MCRLLFFCSFLLFTYFIEAASPLKVEVSAKAAILMNAKTGAILWEKNSQQPHFPASITKILTAVYAYERQGNRLEEMITASSDALLIVPTQIRRGGGHPPYRLELGGSSMGLKVGETLSFKDLMYGLMLSSGNDSANVLAEHTSGKIEDFVKEMNIYAEKKGCKHTTFRAPHGLHHPEHKTSAFDMAVISRELLKNPFLRTVVKTIQHVRPATNKQAQSILYQKNALLKQGKFFYPKAIGIKSGYTLAARYNLVAAAEDSNRELIAVVLGCEQNEQRYQDVIALFDAGFSEKRVERTLFSKGFDLLSCPIQGAKHALQAYLPEDVTLHYYPSEESEFQTSIYWNTPPLPIKIGQKVGEIRVFGRSGQMLVSTSLLAAKGVKPTLTYKMHLFWVRYKKYIQGGLCITAGMLVLLFTLFYHTKRQKAE